MPEVLLDVKELSIGIKSTDGALHHAVESVSFHMEPGRILGIVGESGCGKSITALSIAGLLPRSAVVTGGSIRFNGSFIHEMNREQMSEIQGKDLSMIFQEPMTSMNPLMTVGKQIAETLRIHTGMEERKIRNEVLEVMYKVGLPETEKLYRSYPHQLSGGMRQRAMIAMALICKPRLIIADEPTTALDVTIQAQILELLKKINREYGTAILFISHDLGVIRQLCERVAVMYAGNIIEEGFTADIFHRPCHPYTVGLIGSIPTRSSKGKRLANISGKVPAITEKIPGCSFSPRCPHAFDRCFVENPDCTLLDGEHKVRCHLAGEGRGQRDGGE